MTPIRTVVVSSLATALLTLAACGHEEPQTSAANPKPLQARLGVTELVHQGASIEVQGTVQPARQSFLSGRLMGSVVAVKVQAGDVVRKDQILAEIQPETSAGQLAQAEGALAQARAGLTMAERNFRRYESLHRSKSASDVELDLARMQFEQAEGAVRQAEGAVQAASSVADDALVRAPFAARVVDTLVEVGDLAAPGRPLVQLESLGGRSIHVSVGESDIQRLKIGQVVPVTIDSRPDLGTINAEVVEIVPTADSMTHSFAVKLGLGSAEVASGIAGRAQLPGDGRETIAVAAGAVHRRGGLELVIVRADDGTARTRAVTTGAILADGRIEILSGLDAGESVVVDAPAPVADGTPIEVRS